MALNGQSVRYTSSIWPRCYGGSRISRAGQLKRPVRRRAAGPLSFHSWAISGAWGLTVAGIFGLLYEIVILCREPPKAVSKPLRESETAY